MNGWFDMAGVLSSQFETKKKKSSPTESHYKKKKKKTDKFLTLHINIKLTSTIFLYQN